MTVVPVASIEMKAAKQSIITLCFNLIANFQSIHV